MCTDIFGFTVEACHVDPQTNCIIPYCPKGRFVNIPPPYSDSDCAKDFGRPWWREDAYLVGILSQKTRLVQIINPRTSQDQVIEVCSEEIIETLSTRTVSQYAETRCVCVRSLMTEIQDRYMKFNAHAGSYTWKYEGKNLDMGKTLQENDIDVEDEEFFIS
ncbi:cytochrome b5 domain-containing protein 1 [Elysia marginata]|uniref:Cytochrome b5 domain-containing protein 1 n=1 Tax=Elysia marginata TaxID=1093978 RepID=A0AAV4HHQ9_9GAST|nr:cytochrome b5 domain-containing protein 1 [Elysia marginata]